MDALLIERIIVLILVGATGFWLLKAVYRLVRFLMKYRNEHGSSGLALLIGGAVLALWGIVEFFIFIGPYLVYILAAVVGYLWFTSNSFKKNWWNSSTSNILEEDWYRAIEIDEENRRNGF